MKRVLIVSPHFPPTNAPDHQRIRMALPWLEHCGWQADIVSINPAGTTARQDPSLVKATEGAGVFTCSANRSKSQRLARINSLWIRHGKSLEEKGTELLQKNHYDLIFFSTTQFPFFRIGPGWKHDFGIPFICDFQDPWLSNFYFRKSAPSPPGGWIRYFPNWLSAKYHEKRVIEKSDGIVSVSPQYLKMIHRRYNPGIPMAVIPFGAPTMDFEYLSSEIEDASKKLEAKDDFVIRYTGRAGSDMNHTITFFLQTLRLALGKSDRSVRVEFHGSSYSQTDDRRIESLAKQFALKNIVYEQPSRIDYATTLAMMKSSNLVPVFGSQDRSYSPSKLASVFSFSKQMIVVADRDSVLYRLAKSIGVRNIINPDMNKETAADILLQIMNESDSKPPRPEAIHKLSAETMTKKMCRFFGQVVDK